MNQASILRDKEFAAMKRHVLQMTGLGYYADRDEDFATRLARRMDARSTACVGDYYALLLDEPLEADCLIGELTIGETYFFRQYEQFEFIRQTILPELLSRKSASRTLRIWSAGCATGAEPYSLACLLGEFESLLAGWDISITGTDINTDFLERARRGVFNEWALRETAPEMRYRCLRQEGSTWVILPHARNRVKFEKHNLVTGVEAPGGPGSRFDLILCRNVLIYFSRETIDEVVGKFYNALGEGGWLLVGHAEPNINTFRQFETVQTRRVTAYRRSDHRTVGPGIAPPWITPFEWSGPELPRTGHFRESAAAAGTAAPGIPAPKTLTDLPPIPVDSIRLLANAGERAGAMSAIEALIATEPLNATAHFTHGLLLAQTDTHAEARTAWRRAIYLNRGFALAHYHLGASLQKAGDAPAARKSFHNVLRLLQAAEDGEPVPEGYGLTSSELRGLVQMHMELLRV